MNSPLIHAVAESRQQDLLRAAEQRRLARELPRRSSPLAHLMSSIPSLSFRGRGSAQLQPTAPAPIDA